MDEVFRALGNNSRRRLMDHLHAEDGQTLGRLCDVLYMTRQSASRHLRVLEAANLITTVWHGREKLHYLNPAPLTAITDRWLEKFDRHRLEALGDLKRDLETRAMAKPEFVYTTYIHASADDVWQAITDPDFTRRYWGAERHTDWEEGSTFTWEERGVAVEHPDQVVLESDRPHRLSHTWHTFTQELAGAYGMDEATNAQLAAEPRSRVTFTIEQLDDIVKLTVVHDGFEPGSSVLESISQGWPAIIANLKTLLETGEPMPEPEAFAPDVD